MPLSAWAVAAYAAGLLLGFADHATLAALSATAASAAGGRARRTVPLALGLFLLGGAAVARATVRADAACAARLMARGAIRVTVKEAAAPGAFVAAAAAACHADVSLAVARGRAAPGDRVLATGAVVRSRRGLLVQQAELTGALRGSLLPRWRAAAGARVDALFGSDAPLARALLVADVSAIPAAMRDRYAAAGLAHMLSISGLHVALIAGALALVLDVLRVPSRRAHAATLGVIAGYVAMLGFPSPALRSAVMLGALLASRRWQRPTSPWAILAIGAAMPLADPRAVTAVDYQLSVGGVAALIGAAALGRRWCWFAARRGAVRAVVGTALASTMATVVTAPLVAWNFGRLSLVGPLANVAAGPVMAIAQPMLFLSLALSPVRPVARLFADAAHPLLRAFDAIAGAAAAVPGGAIAVAPSALAAAGGVVFSVALVSACVSRFPAASAAAAIGALALVAWAPLAPARSGRTELHLLDVGQGNAVALRTARGRWVLMDAGRAWTGGDDGRSTIVPYLAHRGGPLVAFVLGADRADAVGGAATVLRSLVPRFYYDGFTGQGSAAYRTSLLQARRSGVAWRRAGPGDSLVVDEVTLTFLAPDSAESPSGGGPPSGLVVRARVGAVTMLLAADAGARDERWLIAHRAGDLAADVLVVGRHGSPSATTDDWIARVAPRVSLVSVGALGSYGLPSAEVLERLAAAGGDILRTDRLSTIVLTTDGHSLRVSAGGDEWPLSLTPSRTPRAPPPPRR